MTANSHPGLCGSTGLGGGPRSPPPTHTPRPCARPAALRTLRGPPRDRGLRGFPPCGPAWACAPCEYLWGGRTCPKRRRLRPCPPRLLLRTRAQTRGQTLLPWDGRDTEGWWPGPRPALRPRGPRGLRCTRGRLRRPRRPCHRDSPEVQTRGLHLTTCGCAAPRPPGADVSRSPAPPGAVRLRSQLPGAMPRAGAAPPGTAGGSGAPTPSRSHVGVAPRGHCGAACAARTLHAQLWAPPLPGFLPLSTKENEDGFLLNTEPK